MKSLVLALSAAITVIFSYSVVAAEKSSNISITTATKELLQFEKKPKEKGNYVAATCQVYYDGCRSCVADGIWGSLRHNADCTTSCDKVCGNEPAK